MGGFLSFLLDTLLPCECLVCWWELRPFDAADAAGAARETDRMAGFRAADIRLALFGGLSVAARLLCERCWLALEPASARCALEPPAGFASPIEVVTPFLENDELLAVIRFLKFSGGRAAVPSVAWWMAAALRAHLAREPRGDAPPLLVPVPLHPRRERSRGYNQAALLAGAVSRRLGLDVDARLLARVRHTKSQSTLSAADRGANVRGAFVPRRNVPRLPRPLILVDDLVTTGETALACAAALSELGPASLAVLSAGRSRVVSAGPKRATRASRGERSEGPSGLDTSAEDV